MHVPALDREPDVYPDLVWAWDAWCELSGRRQAGFSPNPITYEAAVAWLNENGAAASCVRQVLHDAVGILDGELFRLLAEENERNAKKKK